MRRDRTSAWRVPGGAGNEGTRRAVSSVGDVEEQERRAADLAHGEVGVAVLVEVGDGELVAEVVADWSCPEINYALTLENVQRFRNWLNGEESYSCRPTSMANSDGHLISVTEKQSIRKWWKRY